jgi:hypothetical protein
MRTRAAMIAPGAGVFHIILLAAQLGDTIGHLRLPGEAAGVAFVGHESGVLIGLLLAGAPGPGADEGLVTGILQNGHHTSRGIEKCPQ